jgi:hypothetical protein
MHPPFAARLHATRSLVRKELHFRAGVAHEPEVPTKSSPEPPSKQPPVYACRGDEFVAEHAVQHRPAVAVGIDHHSESAQLCE